MSTVNEDVLWWHETDPWEVCSGVLERVRSRCNSSIPWSQFFPYSSIFHAGNDGVFSSTLMNVRKLRRLFLFALCPPRVSSQLFAPLIFPGLPARTDLWNDHPLGEHIGFLVVRSGFFECYPLRQPHLFTFENGLRDASWRPAIAFKAAQLHTNIYTHLLVVLEANTNKHLPNNTLFMLPLLSQIGIWHKKQTQVAVAKQENVSVSLF